MKLLKNLALVMMVSTAVVCASDTEALPEYPALARSLTLTAPVEVVVDAGSKSPTLSTLALTVIEEEGHVASLAAPATTATTSPILELLAIEEAGHAVSVAALTTTTTSPTLVSAIEEAGHVASASVTAPTTIITTTDAEVPTLIAASASATDATVAAKIANTKKSMVDALAAALAAGDAEITMDTNFLAAALIAAGTKITMDTNFLAAAFLGEVDTGLHLSAASLSLPSSPVIIAASTASPTEIQADEDGSELDSDDDVAEIAAIAATTITTTAELEATD